MASETTGKRVRSKPTNWWAAAPSPVAESAKKSGTVTASRDDSGSQGKYKSDFRSRRRNDGEEVQEETVTGKRPRHRSVATEESEESPSSTVRGAKQTKKGPKITIPNTKTPEKSKQGPRLGSEQSKAKSTQGEDVELVAGKRRGRSSNTESELRAINYKETATRKSSQAESDGGTERLAPVFKKPQVATSTAEPRRGRSSNTEAEIRSINYKEAKTRARNSLAGTASEGPSSQQPGSSQTRNSAITPKDITKKKKRKASEESKNTHSQASKRRRSEILQEEAEAEVDLPEYQQLAAVTRRVSHATIDAKWGGLPAASIDHISQLLQDASKPVLAQIRDDRHHNHASTALQWVERKLVGKISKGLPFPPSSRASGEDDFDFEKLIDFNRSLESHLTRALHSNELLEAELAKQLMLLEAETEFLAELEGNAKAESSKRKQDLRKMHPLLQTLDEGIDKAFDKAVDETLEDIIILKLIDAVTAGTFDLHQDDDLGSVVQDLQGHLDSIEGNFKQIQDIPRAMARSKAAVQATLLGGLNQQQYQHVVLG